jgi:microcystin-dependent protein
MSSGQQSGGGGDAAPIGGLSRLTESEQKLVAKLLSDPTYFPVEFRTWLKQFFEAADIRITQGQIVGGGGSNVATGLPAGVVLGVAASAAVPADCLICDGTAKLRADYLSLYAAIGDTWGAGDGSTTFNLPDYRDRALYGQGGRVALGQAGTDGVALGSRGGPDHRHSFGQTSGAGSAHSHGHSLSVQSVGSHSHSGTPLGIDYLIYAGTANLGSGGTLRNVGGVRNTVADDGGHGHGLSGGINNESGHTHFVSGDTSGGFALNHGSYAGVIWVITIGASG